ncbi:carbohydrate-binding protein [Luteolibacter arcticus]|uniref:Carbohydrate-binding protein n=1 Tax=Luteolibacter arcticus TaxID=1581411 RepID=A0ABT3GK76_9BACT|nr:carbohydrate-binding protein [Luteolibacter arcticus]MCW1923896.1 carbohydrate-binding protein [Luteolibacter arcticus]
MNFPYRIVAVLAAACLAASATEYHVSPAGNDANQGSSVAMLKTISEGARRAQPGDTITVHEGVYRERIDPPRGGTDDAHRIVYQAAPGENVVIKGSEPATGWVHEANDTWKLTLPNSSFGLFNPFNVRLRGDWFIDNGRVHHCGSVFLNGHWLTETTTSALALQPAGATPLWHADVDGGGYLLNVSWMRPVIGAAPAGRVDTINYTTRNGVMPAASSEGGQCLGYIEDGDWARYASVNFGTETTQVQFRVASQVGGGIIEVHAGSPTGSLLGSCPVPSTGGWQTWQTVTADIAPTSGVQSLCLVFRSKQFATGNTTIRAQFKGVDPNVSNVEISARDSVFYPSLPELDFITVRGFTMEQAATQWEVPNGEQFALIGTHWSKGWVIEDNVIRYSTCAGVSLGKYGDRWDSTSGNTATAFEDTIDRALADGWSKEHVGSHIVRNNEISNCEQVGICGGFGGAFSTITGNAIHDIHIRRLFSGWEMGGIKFHGAIDTEISANHIFRCCRGIWLDWMTQGTHVTRNLFHDNDWQEDLYVEVNHGPFLVDHNVFLSSRCLKDKSQGGAYAHNLFAGAIESSNDTRVTPFFAPHSTELVGTSNIKGGDSRYYNNLFVGAVSLGNYNNTILPVSMNGNVFVKGAVSSTRETTPIVSSSFDPGLQLRRESDGFYLDITLDGTWDDQRTRSRVTSLLLGSAAIPNAPFEQADGSPYQLDTDYLGVARNTGNPFPGPFELPAGGAFSVKVSSTLEPAGPAATLLTVSPLAGSSFEAPAKADGVQDEIMTGWTNSASGSRVENPNTGLFSNQFNGNTTNVPDGIQDLALFKSSTGDLGWAYQVIQGTTSANPAVHSLTGEEAAGRTFRITFQAGRGLTANTYQDTNMRFTVGLQAQNSASFHAKADYEKLGTTGFGTALNLAKGEWKQVSVDLTMPDLPFSGSEPVAFVFALNAANANATAIQLDAVSIELLAEPQPLIVTACGFNGGAFELTVTGFDTGKQYLLKRATNLESFESVGSAFTPLGVTAIITDPSPPASRAFYRVEEAP